MKAVEIADIIIRQSGVTTKLERTCDIFAWGSPETEVTGIVTTFMATVNVIKEAVAKGANMIITHEPTYFTGWDTTDWLVNDPVYQAKTALLEANNMVIWRFHDHMHMMKPDSIYDGLNKQLGWSPVPMNTNIINGKEPTHQPKDFIESFGAIYEIPEITLAELCVFMKDRFGMKTARIIGKESMPCSRIGVLVGGGSLGLGSEQMPMQVMQRHNLDVIVAGEVTEWTLCAYVNDAQMLGLNRGLLIIGHERTEEWGMKFMPEWLQPLVPAIPVNFVDAQEPFVYI